MRLQCILSNCAFEPANEGHVNANSSEEKRLHNQQTQFDKVDSFATVASSSDNE